jgi:thiamine pyrophosphate-dependent acetolactate synthase large subunit-like protein
MTKMKGADIIAEYLVKEKVPYLFGLCGHGAVLSEAAPELRKLAELLNIPIATTANGKGVIPADHPLSLGPVGRNGSYMANEACRSCDVLLALGVKFDDRQSSAWIPGYTFNIPPTKLIHIEIDSDEMARNYPPSIGILGDAKTFLKELLCMVENKVKFDSKRNKEWLTNIENWKKDWEEFNHPQSVSDAVPIQPERLVKDIRDVMPRDGILLADVGEHHNWLLQFYDVYEPGGMLQSWGFASDGIWHLWGAGGKTGRSRQGLWFRLRRRRIYDDSSYPLHGGGIRRPGRLDHLEQLWMERDSPSGQRGLARARDCHQLQERQDGRTDQPGFRSFGRCLRRQGRQS